MLTVNGPATEGKKIAAIGIGVLAGLLGAWLNAVEMSQGEPQPNSVYASLGLSGGFALPALAYLLRLYGQSREREAESELRRQLLERISKEVEDRRQDALDQLYHIPRSGIKHSSASSGVFRPIQLLVENHTRLLDVSISNLFVQEDVREQLLILGEPGSGKTTELLGLANTLCQRAEKDPQAPIPIIFEWSDWRPSRKAIDAGTLNRWMVEQLQLKYGLDPQLSQDLLHRNRILPLLDGLDELQNFMAEAILAVNAMQEDKKEQHFGLVICSRAREYKDCPENLRLRTAVELKPLDKNAIKNYLHHREASHLWPVLNASPKGWLKLAKTPLLLDLMPQAYPAPLVPDCPASAGEAACRHRLFEDYSHRQLAQEDNLGYSEEESRRYLQRLAQILRRQGQTEFLIEEMQPDWLETPTQKRLFNWGTRLIEWLILWLIGGTTSLLILILSYDLRYGLSYGLTQWLNFGLSYGLIFVPIFLLIGSNQNNINLTESFDFSLLKLNVKKYTQYVALFVFGFMIIGRLTYGKNYGLIGGLVFGLIFGLIFIISSALRAKLKVRSYPNQGVWESLKKSIIFSGMSVLAWMVGFSFIYYLWLRAVQEPRVGSLGAVVVGSIGIGLFTGTMLGGLKSVFQHVLLRWILFQNRAIPWNYAHFLNYASQRNLLKQSGGRFRFYHDLLREHFAGEDTERLQLALAAPSRPWLNWTLAVMLFLGWLLFTRNIQTVALDTAMMMSPTLEVQDQVLTDDITYGDRTLKRGDIIIFKSPNTSANAEEQVYSRRILGLPHETVEIRQGQAWINHRPLDSLPLPPGYERDSFTLGADEYFVVGDNHEVEELEGFAEIVSRPRIQAQVLLRIAPLSRFGRLDE